MGQASHAPPLGIRMEKTQESTAFSSSEVWCNLRTLFSQALLVQRYKWAYAHDKWNLVCALTHPIPFTALVSPNESGVKSVASFNLIVSWKNVADGLAYKQGHQRNLVWSCLQHQQFAQRIVPISTKQLAIRYSLEILINNITIPLQQGCCTGMQKRGWLSVV